MTEAANHAGIEPISAPRMAGHVEIREADFMFTVDGEPFPWFITTAGPRVTVVSNELAIVGVSIIPSGRTGDLKSPPIFEHGGFRNQPIIGDRAGWPRTFPWLIHESGITYRVSRRQTPVVRLRFLAQSVFSYDVPILQLGTEEAAPLEVQSIGGDIWKAAGR